MRSLVLPVIAVVGLLLAGCVPEPVPRATAGPTVEPFFASQEEALAAAQAVYAEYILVSDLISAEGWKDPERVAPFVTDRYLEQQIKTMNDMSNSGLQPVGAVKIPSFELQFYSEPDLVAYVCHDVEGVRILNSEGRDVTPIDRPNSVLLEVTFRLEDGVFRIAGSDLWSEVC